MSENKYPIGGYAPDSDARALAPTFDEMVGLIEKLFKDSLIDTKLFTDAEIERGWQRYKVLNHLYQDRQQHEIKYGQLWARHSELVNTEDLGKYRIDFEGLKKSVEEVLSMQPKPSGAAWVNVSEYKFKATGHYPYRFRDAPGEGYDYGEIYVTDDDGEIFFDVDHENEYIPQNDGRWLKYDILDESGTASNYESVFVPCAEDDPNVSGGYTSNDGRSLCYVKEALATIKK